MYFFVFCSIITALDEKYRVVGALLCNFSFSRIDDHFFILINTHGCPVSSATLKASLHFIAERHLDFIIHIELFNRLSSKISCRVSRILISAKIIFSPRGDQLPDRDGSLRGHWYELISSLLLFYGCMIKSLRFFHNFYDLHRFT